MEDGLGREGDELRQRQYPGPGLEAPMPVGALETLPVLPHPRPGLLSLSPAAGGQANLALEYGMKQGKD